MNPLFTTLEFSLVLASGSPRRRQLLSGMNLPFSVISKETDESFPKDMPGRDIAEYLCSKKSDAFEANELPENFLLITADTVVVVDDQILNKASTKKEAQQMLRQLSGKWHEVITGICLRSVGKKQVCSTTTAVKFAVLSEAEIEWYIENYKPYDKAGAYGIQEWIGYIGIEEIKGSFYNVMGLPTQRLYQELIRFLQK
ncbi:MAG: Maf family nucleotide pyrophosphatase [Bacteroidales bacterium]|nr:Maf family nucleotide pyrophosphatase [Bacteroidales bacterium]